MERTQPVETEANFSIEEYGAKTAEKEECEEQLLTEYATLLGFYLASVGRSNRDCRSTGPSAQKIPFA
jgi:hypothetical protein